MNVVFQVVKDIWQVPAYVDAESYLTQHFPEQHAAEQLRQYTFQLFSILFQHKQSFNITAITAHREKLIRMIHDEPHAVRVVAYLSGVILESPEIVINEHIRLRQTQVTDMEQQKHHSSGDVAMIVFPSAILEINTKAKKDDFGAFQPLASHYVNLLRLFKTGSVNNDFTQVEFDTITSSKRMSMGEAPPLRVWQQYVIYWKDEARLLDFLDKFKLPVHERTKPNYLSTAFDRYKETLLENATFERRVANAIMGLEALLSEDTAELTFRLSNRAALLLSFFDLQALAVRNNLTKAYGIRSKYAHGGFLDEKHRKKIEAEFVSLDQFALTIVNFVRLLYLIITLTTASKKELLTLIDDAYIDGLRRQQLELLLADAKQILLPVNN